MDIPSSGAIFTLGNSHLAENTQSYFYIKNDPVKRLISGPHQSAVICESGRLFVWGENHYGQLGIGGNNTNKNNNNNSNNNGDIITKPTCVKSLKALGLKIADIAFGNDWAVILTHSNELFFTGRNIFAEETSVARNFTEATVEDEQCLIIRKPFRLEEFDDCLSKSEEAENYVAVLAGNEHFAVMTSFGRLIGWGSNQSHQLSASKDQLLQPYEIKLEAPIQQFICGPESTLVLTESGSLHLAGRLNEFVFPHFTELQKNLAPTEQIIFMHISKANEIYIVTNAGSIYRSMESVRNKSLIFQRFYDYDSEENGPIWKLLKGFSFYTVLTKANKFYTTFSESGHHLKTFREISKFKNLRLLDMAVGERHILVYGIPRSSTLSATMGPSGEHRFMSRTYVMNAPDVNGNAANGHAPNGSARSTRSRNGSRGRILEESKEQSKDDENGNKAADVAVEPAEEKRKETPKTNTPIHESVAEVKGEANAAGLLAANVMTVAAVVNRVNGDTKREEEIEQAANEITEDAINANVESLESARVMESSKAELARAPQSPTESIKSRKSQRSIKFEQSAMDKSPGAEKLLRPRTPYPESSSTTASTPQTVKKTPLRNFSYEAAMAHDYIERTTPALINSLENIAESVAGESCVSAPITAIVSTPTPPLEEDEQLTVEINTTTDALDRTIVVNEIRFINNGVDVTANIKEKATDSEDLSIEDSLDEPMESLEERAHDTLDDIEQQIDKAATKAKEIKDDAIAEVKEFQHEVEEEVIDVKNKMVEGAGSFHDKVKEEAIDVKSKMVEGAENMHEKVEAEAKDAKNQAEAEAKGMAGKAGEKVKGAAEKVETTLHDARESVETAAKKAATGARDAMDTVGENAKRLASDARQSVENAGNTAAKAAGNAKNAVENAAGNAKNAVENAAGNAKNAVENAAGNAKNAVESAAGNAKNSVENAGSSAMKVAGNAMSAVENVLFKMADNTKLAVDTAATKISNEVSGAKQNFSSLLHGGKSSKEAIADKEDNDSLTSKEGGAKTNTTGEDDERTTASVNSNQTSAGNPFENENSNPFESTNPFDTELDDVVERGKQAMRNDLQLVERHTVQEAEKSKGRVRQFLSDMRAKGKGMSCRSEKSIRIDDEPPRYSVEDEFPTPRRHNSHSNQQNTSKVCSIL